MTTFLSIHFDQIGSSPVGLALFTRPWYALSMIWPMLIEYARAFRSCLSSSGFFDVFGNSQVVFAPRWYGALAK